MRPAGEIRQALLQACESGGARSQDGRAPYLARNGGRGVGLEAARRPWKT